MTDILDHIDEINLMLKRARGIVGVIEQATDRDRNSQDVHLAAGAARDLLATVENSVETLWKTYQKETAKLATT